MANVFFKRGSLANLSTQPKVDGTIYITTDERAMYVDVDSQTRIRIGDFREYANWSAINSLSAADKDPQALYYANNENILAKWDATNQRWVQVNGQQAINSLISYVHQSAVTNGNNTILTTGVTDTDGVRVNGQVTYTTSNSDLLKVTGTSTTDTDSNSSTYGRTTATITLTPANIVDSVSVATANVTNGTSITLSNNRTGTDANGTTVNTSTALDAINLISKGGLTISKNATTGDIEFKAAGTLDHITTEFTNTGLLNMRLYDLDGNEPTYTSQVTPIIRYGQTTTSDAVFASGTAVLDVYTTGQVDNLISDELKAINAMTFKGTLGADGTVTALPTNNVENGDTYKVISALTYNGQACRVGDMFIASGTENTSGYIPTEDIIWNYIPSGNDETSAYSFTYNSTSGLITFADDNGPLTHFSMGANLTASAENNIITIAHDTVTRTNTTGTAVTQTSLGTATFNAITSITSDSTGHITEVVTTPITVVDTHNTISTVTYGKTIATADGTTTVTTNLTVTDENGGHSGSNTVKSSSLNLSVSGTETTVDLVWGAF